MIKPDYLKNHFFLQNAAGIHELCKPLERFGIKHFTYLKKFCDGSEINLSNSAKWLEDYYCLSLFKTSLFEFNPDQYKSGMIIWPKESKLHVFAHGREYFDSDNGITLIESGPDYCEFYFFSSSKNNYNIINFYINNLDILKRFILYFKEQSHDLIKKSEKNRIITQNILQYRPHNEEKILDSVLSQSEIQELKFAFNQETSIKNQNSIVRKLEKYQLTEREIDVINYLTKGKTAKQTARYLIISNRTVEKHLENIKKKLGCENKMQILSILV